MFIVNSQSGLFSDNVKDNYIIITYELAKRGSLLILARMMVLVLHRDLEREVEMLKYVKLEVMQPRFICFCNFVVIE